MVKMMLAAWIALSCAMGCAPLTFSKDEVIDFSAYPAVRVEVRVGPQEHLGATAYLAKALRESSGFEEISYDSRVAYDAELLVDVMVTAVGDDKFEAGATYRLIDAEGRIIDDGEIDDRSWSSLEAREDVLDEIALHYHRPYRI